MNETAKSDRSGDSSLPQAASEPGRTRTRGPRFSLATLLIAALVLPLAISHWSTSWRLRQAQREIAQLRLETGHLEIQDPGKVHLAAAPTRELRQLKWRCFLPEGARYRLSHALSENDADASVSSSGYSGLGTGESVFTVKLENVAEHKWTLLIDSRSQQGSATGTVGLSPTQAEWLVENWGKLSDNTIGTRTQLFDPDKPIPLLSVPAKESGSAPKPNGSVPGIRIWLQPY